MTSTPLATRCITINLWYSKGGMEALVCYGFMNEQMFGRNEIILHKSSQDRDNNIICKSPYCYIIVVQKLEHVNIVPFCDTVYLHAIFNVINPQVFLS